MPFWRQTQSFFEYAPRNPFEFWIYCKQKYRYYKMKPEPNHPPINEEELNELLELSDIAREKSQLNAALFECDHPLTDQADHSGTILGGIHILPEGARWPEHEGMPMLPLLQLEVRQLAVRPTALLGVDYLLVWCGVDASEDMPVELFHKLYELTETDPSEAAVSAFHEQHADQISTIYSPNPESVRVIAIGQNAPIQPCESQDPYSILNSHKAAIKQVQDSIDHNESRFLQFLTPEQSKRYEELFWKRKISYQQHTQIDARTGNHDRSKIGGWPSNQQHFVDFDGKADFVLQIQSDEQIGLQLGDDGIIYIGYNTKSKEWVSDWACY